MCPCLALCTSWVVKDRVCVLSLASRRHRGGPIKLSGKTVPIPRQSLSCQAMAMASQMGKNLNLPKVALGPQTMIRVSQTIVRDP